MRFTRTKRTFRRVGLRVIQVWAVAVALAAVMAGFMIAFAWVGLAVAIVLAIAIPMKVYFWLSEPRANLARQKTR